jgi:hypothetical protein
MQHIGRRFQSGRDFTAVDEMPRGAGEKCDPLTVAATERRVAHAHCRRRRPTGTEYCVCVCVRVGRKGAWANAHDTYSRSGIPLRVTMDLRDGG